jgi:hypothetical protein
MCVQPCAVVKGILCVTGSLAATELSGSASPYHCASIPCCMKQGLWGAGQVPACGAVEQATMQLCHS